MRKILFILCIAFRFGLSAQTCNALFSFSAYFEKVSFFNQSTVSNAHYYWDFGDGTSSYVKNPVHTFPGNGIYFVTLYVQDTINSCSDYYEMWLPLSKNNFTNSCLPDITDSVYTFNGTDYVKILDNSINCEGWDKAYFSAGGNNMSNMHSLGKYPTNYYPANYISFVSFSDYPFTAQHIAVKTLPYHFNKAKNYNSCSANFEFSVVSETNNSQRIRFKAMNKNTSYHWYLTGFGDPIQSIFDTVSAEYSKIPDFYMTWGRVFLFTQDQNGCRDSMVQIIATRPASNTTVGFQEPQIDNLQLTIFPNPAKEKISIQYIQGLLEIEKLEIISLLGQQMLCIFKPEVKKEIDIEFLPAGTYLVSVSAGSSKKVFKVLKE